MIYNATTSERKMLHHAYNACLILRFRLTLNICGLKTQTDEGQRQQKQILTLIEAAKKKRRSSRATLMF